ncbi:hypothetical protein J4212_07850 [Candidatus Woesearchaeota archaeon]|nr:hypothetical protein [Candidatus Woesearchaeota archaeon]
MLPKTIGKTGHGTITLKHIIYNISQFQAVKMHRTLLILILFALSAHSAAGVNLGVFVEHKNGDYEVYCIGVNEGDDAFKVLSKIEKTTFKEINNQHILCNIGDGEENFICDANSKYAWFPVLQTPAGRWHDAPIASYDAGNNCYDTNFNSLLNFPFYSFQTHTFSNTRYCAKEGDVLGIYNDVKPSSAPEPELSITPNYAQICKPLEIKDVEVYVNGIKKKSSLDDGDKIKGVAAGSELKLKFDLKNIRLGELTQNIQDIQIIATLEGISNGKDLEDVSDDFDLQSEKKKSAQFTFSVPDGAKEGTYDLTIEFEGEDEDGYIFKEKIEAEVEIVQKEEDNIGIAALTYPNEPCIDGRCEKLSQISANQVTQPSIQQVAQPSSTIAEATLLTATGNAPLASEKSAFGKKLFLLSTSVFLVTILALACIALLLSNK